MAKSLIKWFGLAAVAALGGFIADSVSYQLIFGLSAADRLLGMALLTIFTVQLVKKKAGASDS